MPFTSWLFRLLRIVGHSRPRTWHHHFRPYIPGISFQLPMLTPKTYTIFFMVCPLLRAWSVDSIHKDHGMDGFQKRCRHS